MRWPRHAPIARRFGPAPVVPQYRPGLDAMQLHREADAAMYRAKAGGGGKLVCDDGEHERRAFVTATADYRAGLDPERRAAARYLSVSDRARRYGCHA